jgi:hypothetical protein
MRITNQQNLNPVGGEGCIDYPIGGEGLHGWTPPEPEHLFDPEITNKQIHAGVKELTLTIGKNPYPQVVAAVFKAMRDAA